MKITVLILTILIHILFIIEFKFLDDFNLIIKVSGLILLAGFVLMMPDKKKNAVSKFVWELGWGLLWGSLISLSLIILFTIWLSYNFPK